MEYEVENLSLDTLATIQDFDNQYDYSVYRKAIVRLDRLYRQDHDMSEPKKDLKYYAHGGMGREIRATIGWYENEPKSRLVKFVGPKLIQITEDLIEKKYLEMMI